MPDVAPFYSEYLGSTALFANADATGVAWGERGVESETISPLALKADAEAEAARQLEFLSGPLVEDVVVVDGARRDLMLKTIAVTGSKLGYDANGKAVFVIGYQELAATTELYVLRSLA